LPVLIRAYSPSFIFCSLDSSGEDFAFGAGLAEAVWLAAGSAAKTSKASAERKRKGKVVMEFFSGRVKAV